MMIADDLPTASWDRFTDPVLGTHKLPVLAWSVPSCGRVRSSAAIYRLPATVREVPCCLSRSPGRKGAVLHATLAAAIMEV